MTNNDLLRAIRYALDCSDSKLIGFFAEGHVDMPASFLMAALKHEDEPGFEPLSDDLFGAFLDGLVDKLRGKREPDAGKAKRPSLPMNNNRVLGSLKIAFELKDTDMIAIMELASFPISKGELSALFRREGHPNFQPCGDQFLRNFLRGLALRQRALRQKPS